MKRSDYYLGYFKNSGSNNKISILLVTSESQPVSYFVEAPTVNYNHSGTFKANNGTIVNLPDDVVVSKCTDSQDKGIYVNISTDRVTVIGQNENPYNSDTFLALPVTNIPNDTEAFIYYAMSVSGNTVAFNSMMVIVGIEDNTTIKVIPTQQIDAKCHTPPVIDKLQTILIESDEDLTGTKVVTNHQVSVFSGHQNSKLKSENSNHLAEQIPSTNFWGKEHYTVPFGTKSYTIKVLAAFNFTNVTFYCNSTIEKSYIINEGESKNLSYSDQEYCAVYSNETVLVAQFGHGQQKVLANIETGPIMTLVPATNQYLNKLDFSTLRNSDGYKHYLNIVVMTEYYQPNLMFLIVNGENVSLESQDWVPIKVNNITKVYATRIAIREGVAQLFHLNTNASMTAIVYGFAERKSYGHPAGLKLIGKFLEFSS